MTTIDHHHETSTTDLDVMRIARGVAAFFVGALTLACVFNWAPGVITVPAGFVVSIAGRAGIASDFVLRALGGTTMLAVAGTLAVVSGCVVSALIRHASE